MLVMFIVALTGGVGCGKSAVAQCFAQLGVPIIDADDIARRVVAPGMPALTAIEAQFGPQVLDAQGQLRRDWLRQHIFQDPQARQWLESLLHPRIRQVMLETTAILTQPYCLWVVPLLLESPDSPLLAHIQRILVVDASEAQQLQRVMARDGCDADQARAIMAAQLPRQQRLAHAHDVINNDGPQTALTQAVAQLHERYLQLASEDGRASQ